MTKYFDAEETLRKSLATAIGDDAAAKAINVLEQLDAVVLLPTAVENIPLIEKDEKGASFCLTTKDRMAFYCSPNLVSFYGNKIIKSGTTVWLHAVGEGLRLQKYLNRELGRK